MMKIPMMQSRVPSPNIWISKEVNLWNSSKMMPPQRMELMTTAPLKMGVILDMSKYLREWLKRRNWPMMERGERMIRK